MILEWPEDHGFSMNTKKSDLLLNLAHMFNTIY